MHQTPSRQDNLDYLDSNTLTTDNKKHLEERKELTLNKSRSQTLKNTSEEDLPDQSPSKIEAASRCDLAEDFTKQMIAKKSRTNPILRPQVKFDRSVSEHLNHDC